MKTEASDPLHPLAIEIRKLVDTPTILAQLDYVLAENRVYRAKFGKRVPLTEADRRQLVKAGIPVKLWLSRIATIVKPETILRWHQRQKQTKWDYSEKRGMRPGRPPVTENTESLVLRMAEENTWGYDRIVGELKKLGHAVSDTSVGNILRKNGIPFSPGRKGLSWKQFIESHIQTMWAADFFTEEVWTLGGLVTFYCLFFIHIATRRIIIAGCAPHPDSAWVSQQARNFSMAIADGPYACRYLIHDRDASFLPLDGVLRPEGIQIIRTPVKAPNANAFAERFVREARETLDNLVLFGEGSLRRTLKTIEKHHNEQRPHQGIDNLIPSGYDYPTEPCLPELVQCHSSLGGLLNHYTTDKAA